MLVLIIESWLYHCQRAFSILFSVSNGFLVAVTRSPCFSRFLVDDKGVLLLCVFGLPPRVHVDDAPRAVLAALRMARALQQLNVQCKFGVATGRAYCGIVGSLDRREYTVMGDKVPGARAHRVTQRLTKHA